MQRLKVPLMSLQAPLTTTDTAVLSGSLSTHNGNGGGTINLALRRVTSANGWGEVRLLCRLLVCDTAAAPT